MPGINGRTLAERLLLRNPRMKVLYVSGYTDTFIAGHGVFDPEIQLLHKPFTEDALLKKVREVLDHVHARSADIPAECVPGRVQ